MYYVSCTSIKIMTKYVESDLLQIKSKTKNKIIFSRKMVKIKHLLKGVKQNCHKSLLRIKETLKKRVLISFDTRANKKVS